MTPKWSQNGAKATTVDPYKTCAGVVGLHIHPPWGAPFSHFCLESTKKSPKITYKITILKISSQHCPKSHPAGSPTSRLMESQESPFRTFFDPRDPRGGPGVPEEPKTTPRYDFWSIWERFWIIFSSILGQFVIDFTSIR